MSSAKVEAVRTSLDAWNRGDVEVAQAIEGSQRVYLGREAMRKFWDEWHAVWVLTIEVSEVRELRDTVVALGRVRARGQASGIDFDRPIAYVFEFEGGLVRRARSHFDIERARTGSVPPSERDRSPVASGLRRSPPSRARRGRRNP